MADRAFAVIACVGPGTGSALARRFAKAYSVVCLSRKPTSFQPIVDDITAGGGEAMGISTDVADTESLQSAFVQIKQQFAGRSLAAAIYNTGGTLMRKQFLELSRDEFAGPFETMTLGGFMFSQAVLPLLLQTTGLKYPPTLTFTSATASTRGSALFSASAAALFALRAMAQSVAREFGPQGVHVSHAIIDGVIDSPTAQALTFPHPDAKLSTAAIADAYWFLHTQPRTAWTFEMDLRPYVEKW